MPKLIEMSIKDKPKKRGRPATGKDPMVGFRSPKSLIDKIDDAIKRMPEPRPKRAELIRRIVQEWIEANK